MSLTAVKHPLQMEFAQTSGLRNVNFSFFGCQVPCWQSNILSLHQSKVPDETLWLQDAWIWLNAVNGWLSLLGWLRFRFRNQGSRCKKGSKEKAEASKPNSHSCVATFLPTFYRSDASPNLDDDDLDNLLTATVASPMILMTVGVAIVVNICLNECDVAKYLD